MAGTVVPANHQQPFLYWQMKQRDFCIQPYKVLPFSISCSQEEDCPQEGTAYACVLLCFFPQTVQSLERVEMSFKPPLWSLMIYRPGYPSALCLIALFFNCLSVSPGTIFSITFPLTDVKIRSVLSWIFSCPCYRWVYLW